MAALRRPPAVRARTGNDALQRYQDKRDFARTPEPKAERAKSSAAQSLSFVIQKHAASRLHYDFRLELDGVLLSWAVPKGPSLDPADKRMAVRTEDHPLAYASFEGTIPAGQYGAGEVIVWDQGRWEPLGDPRAGLDQGKLALRLHGEKLEGDWELVRMRNPRDAKEAWLLFKKRDAHARPRAEYDIVVERPDSVLTAPEQPKTSGKAAKTSAAPAAKKSSKRKASAPSAVRAELPETIAPQLATLSTTMPTQDGWLYEIKFDGYRVLTRFASGVPRLLTRNGHDWTAKMPGLAKELKALALKSAWIDGEVVALDKDERPDFGLLQNAFDRSATQALTYFVFDLLFVDGRDLRELPLAQRRAQLAELLAAQPGQHVRFSEHFDADPASVFDSACRMKLEGLIAKRADAPYRSGRSATWLKLKCQQRQEFVVGGFVDRANARGEVGSLLLGVHDEQGALIAVGGVGTGWDTAQARELHRRLAKLEIERSPFAKAAAGAPRGRYSRRAAGSERWVKPQLVVEAAFGSWTRTGLIRHASFVGVRSDKPARAITREPALTPAAAAAKTKAADGTATPKATGTAAAPAAASSAARSKAAAAQLGKISHPERVIDASTGATKLDLVSYYQSVAPWLLPHLAGRAVSLLRGPSGIGGQLFFQKHRAQTAMPGVKELDAELWPGHEALLEIDSVEGLLAAAQMNVIEFHTWNSRAKTIDKPDRIVFDLDPGEGVAWARVQEGAQLVKSLLAELGLASWLKTSGGKGLHVVVPIAARWPVQKVRALAQAVVVHMAQTIPERFVAKSGPANRVGKIFVDYLRNTHGATTVAAYSARARPGLGVSMPVDWDQMAQLKSGAHWTIATARDQLSLRRVDPWADYWQSKQSLVSALRLLKIS